MTGNGRRVQLYLPADLIDWWDNCENGDKSSVVADAIRAYCPNADKIRQKQELLIAFLRASIGTSEVLVPSEIIDEIIACLS